MHAHTNNLKHIIIKCMHIPWLFVFIDALGRHQRMQAIFAKVQKSRAIKCLEAVIRYVVIVTIFGKKSVSRNGHFNKTVSLHELKSTQIVA